jgi:crotonobetaine/carnitine-CoA ligase
VKAHTISGMLRERAKSSPDKRYVKFDGEWLSFSDLDAASDRAAAGLASIGVKNGDRIGFFLANCEEFIVLFYACAKVGAVYVPLNIFLKGRFLEYQLDDAGVEILIVDDDGLTATAPILDKTSVTDIVVVGSTDAQTHCNTISYETLVTSGAQVPTEERAPRELAAILYTSGTTGAAKGCMLPDGYFWQQPHALAEAGWAAAGDTIVTSFPMFHVSGLGALLSALVCDACVCFQTTFSASTFMASAKAEGATAVWGVGAMASSILAQPLSPADADCSMRMALWVPLSIEQQRAFERRFNTPVLSAGYGQTEVNPLTMSSLRGPGRPGSAGQCVSYLQAAVVDDDDTMLPTGTVGEIVVRPANPNAYFFQGYWNNPRATLDAFRNLWHHTGDYGSVDDDGFLTFVDRKKDSVRRRGENVSSFEVEAAIAEHPGVQQVAITAVSSPLGEDDIRASIVTKLGCTLEPEELFEFLCDHLPYFAVPRYVDFPESLPVNALNKVMKHLLREEGLPASAWDFEALGFSISRDQRRGSGANGGSVGSLTGSSLHRGAGQ